MLKYSLRLMKVHFLWWSRATCNVCCVLEKWLSRIESFQNKHILGMTFIVQRLKGCNISRKFSNIKWSRLSSYGVMDDGIVPYIFICGYCTQNLKWKEKSQKQKSLEQNKERGKTCTQDWCWPIKCSLTELLINWLIALLEFWHSLW